MSKARIMETIISVAGEISPTLGKTISDVNKQLGGLNDAAIVAGAAVAAIGKAAVDATKYLKNLGTDYAKATNDIAATTGLMGEELEGLKDSMKEVYKANLGESMEDVAGGVSAVYRNTKLVGDELTEVTKAAYMLSDAFGYDIEESSRAAKAMMTNFGISGEEAMGLIAAGAQNGLDFSGEMIDSINEYSVQFAKLGFSADDMFQIFQQGADSGAWNLDKVGDAIKEFSIRSIDGSKTTVNAFTDLGLNADEMMAKFAQGGNEAEYAFKIVTDKLLSMKDEVARDAAGVALFGTQWEDLGVEAVKAMSNAQNAAYDANDALKGIENVKYKDLDSAMEGIKRKVEVALLPAAESVSNAFLEITPKIEEFVERAEPYIADLAEKIGPLINAAWELAEKGIGFLGKNIDKIIPVVTGLVGALVAFKGAMTIANAINSVQKALTAFKTASGAATTAMKLLNKVVGLNPFMKVATIIGIVIAAGVALYKNWDTIKLKLEELGGKVSEIWDKIAGWISGAIERIGEKFPIFGEYLKGWWKSIQDAVNNVKKIFKGIINFISNVFAGNWKGAWKNIVEIFGNIFGAIGNIAKAPINGLIGIINKAIKGINSIGIDLPDWLGGKSFSFNIKPIPMLASGGFTNGVSIAGEAGTEAVISFDPAYHDQNVSYWAQAGRLLGLDPTYALSGSSGGSYTNLGGVTFAPNITVQGSASKDDIVEAIREAYPEFLDMLDELLADREEVVYA